MQDHNKGSGLPETSRIQRPIIRVSFDKTDDPTVMNLSVRIDPPIISWTFDSEFTLAQFKRDLVNEFGDGVKYKTAGEGMIIFRKKIAAVVERFINSGRITSIWPKHEVSDK
ncbi:MAG: hypothetical protein A2Y38_17245 [Spirochaetes bacterium GWB1_59_5]|nr:MAG: hypothetical protein A2Y38_17245 [Spirochaetes bacterium GWB1_59_5]